MKMPDIYYYPPIFTIFIPFAIVMLTTLAVMVYCDNLKEKKKSKKRKRL